MSDPLGPRTITVAGEELTFRSLDHLAEHIDFGVATLRSFGSDFDGDASSNDVTRKVAEIIIASIDLYEIWAPEVTNYWEQRVSEVGNALRDLPSPFQEDPNS